MRSVLEEHAALPTQLRLSPALLGMHRGAGFAPAWCGAPVPVGPSLPPSLAADSPGHPQQGKRGVCRSGWGICSLLESMAKIIPISVALHCVFIWHAPGRIETFFLWSHWCRRQPCSILQGEEIPAGSPARTCPFFCWDLRGKIWTF